MKPRLDISFPLRRQWQYCFGREYEPKEGECLLNHARSGIVMALRAALPIRGRVGVVAYNCHTVVNAIVSAGCSLGASKRQITRLLFPAGCAGECRGCIAHGCLNTGGESPSKPFMDIIRTDNPKNVIDEYRAQGIEAETHFKNCIDWNKEFGYLEGMCPNAEMLVNHMVMVPNYYK